MSILNAVDFEPGSALKFLNADILGYTNLIFGYWKQGLYVYPGYYEGAPSEYSGVLLVFIIDSFILKYAFTSGCKIYTMRQNIVDGNISQSWTEL